MNKLLIFLLLSTAHLVSQNENNSLKTITGIVLHQEKPLSSVNISSTNFPGKGTTSNNVGKFTIYTNVGDILIFTHLGLKTKKILIEDTTSFLNISLKTDENSLEGITINTKKRNNKTSLNIKQREENIDKVLKMGRYNINVRSSGFSIKYINGEKLNPNAISIARALQGKIPGLTVSGSRFGERIVYLRESSFFGPKTPALWDVDGAILTSTPQLDISQIEHVAVLSSLGATNAYGSQAAGGVIIISTKSDYRNKKNKISETNLNFNNEFYKGDAVDYENVLVGKPEFLNDFKTIERSIEASEVYKKQYKNEYLKNNYHLELTDFFKKKYNDKQLINDVLVDFEKVSLNDLLDLKTIAYKYQELGKNKNAIAVYKKIANLKPTHAQSFRDLANSYLEDNDYKNAWKVYKYYLEKGYNIEENDIGDIMTSEMIQTYLKRKEDISFKESFMLPISDKIVESDIRFVFEWNTSDAEFIIEFVNKDKQSFKLENSLDGNNDLIIDQKIKGYTSKEFMIEKFIGDYLINIIYLGNKTNKPTVLKLTSYYNWGRSNQTSEIEVFNLKVINLKTQIKKVN